ncbi:MAG: M14 family zinc carboxypeptidase [Patescibacteria group bacterium]
MKFIHTLRRKLQKHHINLLNGHRWYNRWHRHPHATRIHLSAAVVSLGISALLVSNPTFAAKPKINFNVRVTGYDYGTSVRGNPLTAYTFGDGDQPIWFVAGIHGNEKSSSYLAVDLINYLAANPGAVPENKRVIVIASANPDGFLRNSRLNARGIDLNRNFGSSDWRRYVRKGRQLLYGGRAPFSEKESKALQIHMEHDGVAALVTLHAKGNLVNPEFTKASRDLAKRYAELSETPYLENWSSYATPGTLTLWAEERFGAPSITVELPTYNHPDWQKNFPAILDVIQN